ncbi:MAG: DUF1330 domain-containing protein [Bacteroidota bacterium]
MSVYFIATYNIDNQEEYGRYVQSVVPQLLASGGEVLVADYEATSLEGEKTHAYVVLGFDSEETFRGWYEAPEYAPLKELRLGVTSKHMAVLAKQFVMPTA